VNLYTLLPEPVLYLTDPLATGHPEEIPHIEPPEPELQGLFSVSTLTQYKNVYEAVKVVLGGFLDVVIL